MQKFPILSLTQTVDPYTRRSVYNVTFPLFSTANKHILPYMASPASQNSCFYYYTTAPKLQISYIFLNCFNFFGNCFEQKLLFRKAHEENIEYLQMTTLKTEFYIALSLFIPIEMLCYVKDLYLYLHSTIYAKAYIIHFFFSLQPMYIGLPCCSIEATLQASQLQSYALSMLQPHVENVEQYTIIYTALFEPTDYIVNCKPL